MFLDEENEHGSFEVRLSNSKHSIVKFLVKTIYVFTIDSWAWVRLDSLLVYVADPAAGARFGFSCRGLGYGRGAGCVPGGGLRWSQGGA